MPEPIPTHTLNDNKLLQQNSQQIMNAFSKYGIKIDPQILALNQNKENAISQILIQLESALTRDKDFQNIRVFTFMRCMLLNALAQEANAHYFKSIEMKQLLHDLRELILKMASDNFDRQLRIAENERTKMVECERQLQSMYESMFNQTFDTTISKLSDSKSNINDYNNILRELKKQSKENKKELSLYAKDTAKELIEKHGLKDVNPDLLAAFLEKCMKEKVKAHSKTEKYQSKIAHSLALDDIARAELENIKATKEALINDARHKHKAEQPLFPAQHHKYHISSVRLPTEIKLKIEELEKRQKEIDHEMEKRKINREGKMKDIAALISDPDAILQAQIAAFSKDPAAAGVSSVELNSLISSFNNPEFTSNVKEHLSVSNTLVKKLLDAKEVKHSTKLKQKHEVKSAIKLCEKQTMPVGKMDMISACPADIAAKAQKIDELKAQVQNAKYDYLTPEQMRKKEAKREQKAAAAAAPPPPKP